VCGQIIISLCGNITVPLIMAAVARLQPLELVDKCIGSRIWIIMKVSYCYCANSFMSRMKFREKKNWWVPFADLMNMSTWC
jgi:hypothetical protein